MVKKWMKQVKKLGEITNIDFDLIILNILNGDYEQYDYKKLSGYTDLYRVRVGGYRIIFKKGEDISIILIGTRGDVYKNLP